MNLPASLLRSPLTKLLSGCADLVFPPRCLMCGTYALPTRENLCEECTPLLAKARAEKACPTCAASVSEYEVRRDRCSDCRNLRPKIRGMVRAGSYHGPMGGIVRGYKYHGREELAPMLGEWLADAVACAPWRDRVEAVVSVPTHWKRRFARPFHAADALAAHVAKRIHLLHAPLLRRVRAGPHQVGLAFEARLTNVRGAFELRKGVKLDRPRLLLVDDVRTSGATLNECAKVLHRAGAAEIYAAVVVRVGFIAPGSRMLKIV